MWNLASRLRQQKCLSRGNLTSSCNDPFVCHLCPKCSISRLISISFQYCLEPLSCPNHTNPLEVASKSGGEIGKGGWNSKISAWLIRPKHPSMSWKYDSVSSFLPKSFGKVNAFDLRVSFLSFIIMMKGPNLTNPPGRLASKLERDGTANWAWELSVWKLQCSSLNEPEIKFAEGIDVQRQSLKAIWHTCDVLAHCWEAQCTPSKLAQNKIGFTACWWKPLSRTSKQPTLSSLTGRLVPSSTGKSLQST